jgi:hypothetical protein
MSKPPNQEILDPEGQIPAYNKPGLNPQEFLTSVYQCTTLPMMARIQAAKDVAVYVHARLAQVTQDITAGVKITIEGGLPDLPGTNIIMPHDASHAHAPKKGNGQDPSSDEEPNDR